MEPKELYYILYKKFAKRNWWPVDKKYHEKNGSDQRFEVIVGAILTQNTAWSNVEKALINLKKTQMLDINSIINADIKVLTELIKPSGFFNQKADRLKIICNFFHKEFDNNLDKFFNRNITQIRHELLSLKGIGPETADSILLYAGYKSIFVVDAYTKRICERIPIPTKLSYDEIQEYFQNNLSKNFESKKLVEIYNEFHALIVEFAKTYCKKKPNCEKCPIKSKCNFI